MYSRRIDKLFAIVLGTPDDVSASRLRQTIDRASRVVPRDRILPVVLEQDRPWWSRVVSDLPGENSIEQPLDRGTGAGALLAFLRFFQRDPGARWWILSSLARVRGDSTEAMERGEVLSALADATATGRLQTSRGSDWVEKGKLRWMIGTQDALLGLFRRTQPEIFATFMDQLRGERLFDAASLDRFYPFLPFLDLEKDFLGRAPEMLRRSAARMPSTSHPRVPIMVAQ